MKFTLPIILLFASLNVFSGVSGNLKRLNPISILTKDSSDQNEITFDIKQIQNSLGADVFIMIPAGIPKANDVKVTVKDLFGKLIFESHVEYFDQIIEISFELDKGYYRLEIDAGETHFLKNMTIH